MKGKTVKESSLVSSHLMLMEHSGNFLFVNNRPIGMVHGGKIMTLMDEIAGMVGAKHSGRHVATAVIEKMQFFAPIFIGNKMILKSSVNYTGTTSMEIGIRIEAEASCDGVNEIRILPLPSPQFPSPSSSSSYTPP